MVRIGSKQWSVSTLGRMRWQDHLQFLTQICALQIRQRMRHFRPTRPESTHWDLDQIRIPDTPAARASLDFCASVSDDFLTNHSLRTYFWGALLAQEDRLRYDGELFFVSATLHDTGLVKQLRQKYVEYDCFAVIGGLIARNLVEQQGWQADRCDHVFTNICQHINISVPPGIGIEAHLVQAGAALDVIGARAAQIPGHVQQSLLHRYPRFHFKHDFSELIRKEAHAHPHSRIGYLCQQARFVERINASPFGE